MQMMTTENMPMNVKAMPEKARNAYMKAYNAAAESGKDEAECKAAGTAAAKKMMGNFSTENTPEENTIAMFTESESQTLFMMSLDTMISNVNKAVRDKFKSKKLLASGGDYDTYPWVKEVFKDTAIFQADGKMYSIGWTWKDGAVALGDDKTEVVMNYVPAPVTLPSLPSFFSVDKEIEKDAKLFETGDYPDKGVNVTEADLDNIVKNFKEAPFKLDHNNSVLDGTFGKLKSVYKKGTELWGKLGLNPHLVALAEKAGAKKLSIAIDKAKTTISEVSLVTAPRVATAQMFASDTICFDAIDISSLMPREDLITTFAELLTAMNHKENEVKTNMPDTQVDTKATKPDVDFSAEIKARDEKIAATEKQIADLRFDLLSQSVDVKLKDLKEAGKIVPASEQFAKDILLHGDNTIKFSDGEASVACRFEKFLEAQPSVVNFSETGTVGETEEVTFSDDRIRSFMKIDGCSKEEATEKLKKYGK